VQFSLFGAEAATPTVADLDGLLLAGGDWVREPSGAARLSVLVAGQWRVSALISELARRGLDADTAQGADGLTAVRTALTPALAPDADRWRKGASLRVPIDLALTPSGLRLWALANGRREEAGYLFATGERSPDVHRAGGAQLARLAIAAIEVGGRGGPGWRVTSGKRLRRLAELLGSAPASGEADWLGL
jgi:hypothetical protein